MLTRFGPSLAILLLGSLSIGLVAMGSIGTSDQWVNHGIATVLAATILAGLSYARGWVHFAWPPVLGFLVASVGVVTATDALISIGYGLLLVLTLWHTYQAERPRPERVAGQSG